MRVIISVMLVFFICSTVSAGQETRANDTAVHESTATPSQAQDQKAKDALTDPLFYKGLALYKKHKWDDAQTVFLELLKLDPNHYAAHLSLANIYSTKQQFDRAINEYTICISLDPKRVQAILNLGLLYSKLDQPYKALEYLRKADKLRPEDYLTLFLIGDIYFRLGDHDRALEYFTRVYQLNQKNVKNLLRIADVYQAKKEFGKEAEVYEYILTFKKMFLVYYRLGIVMHELGNTEGEIEAYQHALEITPGDRDVTYNLGLAYYDAGRLNDALKEFLKITADPDPYPDALYQMGYIYAETNETTKAWQTYERLKQKNPEKADELYSRLKK